MFRSYFTIHTLQEGAKTLYLLSGLLSHLQASAADGSIWDNVYPVLFCIYAALHLAGKMKAVISNRDPIGELVRAVGAVRSKALAIFRKARAALRRWQ